jgi:hypothetical protein
VSDNSARGGVAALGRRNALTLAGWACLAGLAAGPGVTGCGLGGGPPAPRLPVTSPVARYWARQRRHGHVNFANWPYYIDAGHQTLRDFTAGTGITVTYAEVITDNASWFAKISPILASGESIGYDLMVITDGFQFSELVTKGELIPLDQRRMTHFYAYASPRFTRRPFDPGNIYAHGRPVPSPVPARSRTGWISPARRARNRRWPGHRGGLAVIGGGFTSLWTARLTTGNRVLWGG